MLHFFNRPFNRRTTAQSAALSGFGIQLGYLGDDATAGAYSVIPGVNFQEPESYDSWTNDNSLWIQNVHYWNVKGADYNATNVPPLITRAQAVAAKLQAVVDEGGTNLDAAQATLDKYVTQLSTLAKKVDDNVRSRSKVATAGTITDVATAGATSSTNANIRDALDVARTKLLNAINDLMAQLANEAVPKLDSEVATAKAQADDVARTLKNRAFDPMANRAPLVTARRAGTSFRPLVTRPPPTNIPGYTDTGSGSGSDQGTSSDTGAATAKTPLPWGMIAVGVGATGLLLILATSGKK